MLLFIATVVIATPVSTIFQYISCYCLSASSDIACTFVFHFNTSHVTVYLLAPFLSKWINIISIHLMLLFIAFQYPSVYVMSHFNTSHVTVYRGSGKAELECVWHFNTSHVTVYRNEVGIKPVMG